MSTRQRNRFSAKFYAQHHKRKAFTKENYPNAVIRKNGRWFNQWTGKPNIEMNKAVTRIRKRKQALAKKDAAHRRKGYCPVKSSVFRRRCWRRNRHPGGHRFLRNAPGTK